MAGRLVPGEGAARRVLLELVDKHGRAGHALEGRALDEVQARLRLHDAHGMARLDGEPDDLDRLVRRDPAGDAEEDPGHGMLPAARAGSGS